MEKEYVKYEQAIALKELGFDEPCFALFNRSDKPVISGNTPVFNSKTEDDLIICTPLYQQTFRWFRKKYNLNGIINHYPNTKLWDFSVHNLEWSGKELMEYTRKEDRSIKFSTYEEAENTCLDKLIEIVKNK